MSLQSAQQVAGLIWQAWREGGQMDAVPEQIRPQSREQGYAAQSELARLSGSPLFGWKIAATSVAGQKHIGVDGPLAGRIFSDRVIPEGRPIQLRGNRMALAECEFAFRMGRDLPARSAPYGLAEVLDAVASLHPAIEMPSTRIAAVERAGAPTLIADNACGHEFMLGQSCGDDWRSINLAGQSVEATLSRTGVAPVLHQGVGANVLGDPRQALRWLVNELSALGLGLGAGAVVTTGTCVPPIPVQPGQMLAIDFGRAGRMVAHFIA